jgi:hypothetical protein
MVSGIGVVFRIVSCWEVQAERDLLSNIICKFQALKIKGPFRESEESLDLQCAIVNYITPGMSLASAEE